MESHPALRSHVSRVPPRNEGKSNRTYRTHNRCLPVKLDKKKEKTTIRHRPVYISPFVVEICMLAAAAIYPAERGVSQRDRREKKKTYQIISYRTCRTGGRRVTIMKKESVVNS